MKKFDYNRSAATAKRLIDRFGGNITIIVTAMTPSSDKWKPATVVETPWNTQAVFLKEDAVYENGTLIQAATQRILFYKLAVDFDPNLTGHIIRGTEKWKFSNVKPLNPAGTVVMYKADIE